MPNIDGLVREGVWFGKQESPPPPASLMEVEEARLEGQATGMSAPAGVGPRSIPKSERRWANSSFSLSSPSVIAQRWTRSAASSRTAKTSSGVPSTSQIVTKRYSLAGWPRSPRLASNWLLGTHHPPAPSLHQDRIPPDAAQIAGRILAEGPRRLLRDGRPPHRCSHRASDGRVTLGRSLLVVQGLRRHGHVSVGAEGASS
jgi:hypothetical protein